MGTKVSPNLTEGVSALLEALMLLFNPGNSSKELNVNTLFFFFFFLVILKFLYIYGFLGGASGKESACQYRRHKRCRFNPWVRKIPWNKKWQPTPVFLPGKFHGQRGLVGYNPQGCKESATTERLSTIYLSIYIFLIEVCCYLVTKLCPTMQPHGLQHTRFPCPPLSPEICSSSCPSSRWCYLTISSSVILFSFCRQSFPASGSFPTNRLFTSDTQKILEPQL